MEIRTERYKISVEQLSEGGPGGYESVYLTSEGDQAEEKLYTLLNGFQGKLLPASSRVIRSRNGEALVKALQENKPIGIASGFKPSGAYHFGHKLTSSAVTFFQQNGAQIFVPVADIECDMDTRMSKEQYQYWAADNLLDWGANGVNLDAAHVYLQSEEARVNTLAYFVARSLTFPLAADIYGMDKLVKDFPFLFAGITQVADILLPQHQDFGNHHSFMVSGQDQDGHMKMTMALTQATLDSGIVLPGIQTVPSGFYIPHIRGISGDKASSSKAAGTLYLGSGPEKEDLTDRIRTSLSKIDGANREDLERCALDMVRYIGFFNAQSKVSFEEISSSIRYKELQRKLELTHSREGQKEVQWEIDEYLNNECKTVGQNNVEIVRDSLSEALTEHQKKREAILSYAKARASYQPSSGWSAEDNKPIPPQFWKVPEKAVVDEKKRNTTQWFDMVVKAGDKIIP